MPLLPAALIEPLWVEFATLIGPDQRPEFSPDPSLGLSPPPHRRPGLVDHVIATLVHRSGYERHATPHCSDRTTRRRLAEWAGAGIGQELLRLGLVAYDQMIDLDLDDRTTDGTITKAPCGGEVTDRSPVDRGKQAPHAPSSATVGASRGTWSPRADDHDSPLLEPTLPGIRYMIGRCPSTVHAPGPRLPLAQDARRRLRRRRRRGERGRGTYSTSSATTPTSRSRAHPPDPNRQALAGRAYAPVDSNQTHHPTPPLTIDCQALPGLVPPVGSAVG